MKKIFVMLLTLGLTLALSACGGTTGDGTAANDESTEGTTYSFTVGTNTAEDSVNQLLAEKFKELIEERSNGEVNVTIYPNGAMGGDAELTESCIAGTVDFVIGMTG